MFTRPQLLKLGTPLVGQQLSKTLYPRCMTRETSSGQSTFQQGELLRLAHLESYDITWKSIIYSLPRGILSFAAQASIDFLPTRCNLKKWGKSTTDNCKLCNCKDTLLHVVNACKVALDQGRYTWRHDSILKCIVKIIKDLRKSVKVYADLPGTFQ